MNKKVIIILSSIIVIIAIFIVVLTFLNKNKVINDYENLMRTNLDLVNNIVNKYEIQKSGYVEVVANYKGAHGENYPAIFNYNYLLSDKLYLEDDHYVGIDLNDDLLKIISVLRKINKIDINNYDKLKKESSKLYIEYDPKYINNLIGTDFKKVNVDVVLKGFIKKLEKIIINLDDIKIVIDKNVNVLFEDINMDIKLDEKATYVNVNNKLKMNIFMKDNYSFSIVINGQVYSLELTEEGANIKFNSSAAIYNSLSIKVKYKEMDLNLKDELVNINDNPIIRYLSESDFSIR